MKTSFNIGDRVQFKSWDELKKEFGFAEPGCINCLGGFTTSMTGLCGTTAIIKEIKPNGVVLLDDLDTSGPKEWVYSLDMLKPMAVYITGEGFSALECIENYFLENFIDCDTVSVRSVIEVINEFKKDYQMEVKDNE